MINVIFAIDRNNLFGNNGKLPWNYSEDLKYFKQMTTGKKLLMGEETFKSIINRNGHPLTDRTSVICTLTNYEYPGVEVTHDIFQYIKNHNDEDLYIIGGKGIISITYKRADVLYITYIDDDHTGDTYMDLDLSSFELSSEKISGKLHFRKYIKRS